MSDWIDRDQDIDIRIEVGSIVESDLRNKNEDARVTVARKE